MSPLLSRILLAILMLPLAATLFFIAFVLLDEWLPWRYRDEVTLALSNGITLVFAGMYWITLWRRSITWSSDRITGTMLATLLALVAGIGVGFVIERIQSDVGWFIWGPVAVSLWLPGTVLVWRETSRERSARIHRMNKDAITCPRCGYNMTGLRESKCPECGSSFTIDELFAGQRGQAERELEPDAHPE